MTLPLSTIGVENFKSFKDHAELQLAPITLLIGPNNSGKSTLINAIKLLQESFGNDSRKMIDLKSFLDTAINTGSMRERYGNLNKFLSDGDKHSFTISLSMKELWLLKNLKLTFEIEVINGDIGKIEKVIITSEDGQDEVLRIDITKIFDHTRYDQKINQEYLKKEYINLTLSDSDID